MKKSCFTFIFCSCFCCLMAVNNLNNESVIKMTRANLGDEIITDEIRNAKVTFELDSASISRLKAEKVSEIVIGEMIKKSGEIVKIEADITNTSETSAVMDTLNNDTIRNDKVIEVPAVETITIESPVEEIQPLKDSIEVVPAAKTEAMETQANDNEIRFVGFVIPVKEILVFYMNDITELNRIFSEWSTTLEGLIAKGRDINTETKRLEIELFAKKASDTKLYNAEMIAIRSQIEGKRASFKQNYIAIDEYAKTAHKAILSEGDALMKRISDTYDKTVKSVKSYDLSAETWSEYEKKLFVDSTDLLENDNLFYPLCELIYFEKNAFKTVKMLIDRCNLKITQLNTGYEEVCEQIKTSELATEAYKKESKKYKAELGSEKKKLSGLNKKKKSIVNDMKSACINLSKELNAEGNALVVALKERIDNIVTDIDYNLQERICFK